MYAYIYIYICIYLCVCAKDGGLQWSIDDKMFRQNASPMTVHRQIHCNSDDCTTQKRGPYNMSTLL